jgi:hypothetical protein
LSLVRRVSGWLRNPGRFLLRERTYSVEEMESRLVVLLRNASTKLYFLFASIKLITILKNPLISEALSRGHLTLEILKESRQYMKKPPIYAF